MYICIYTYIPKYNMLSLSLIYIYIICNLYITLYVCIICIYVSTHTHSHTYMCVCVFRDDHLLLENHSLYSSLEKTISSSIIIPEWYLKLFAWSYLCMVEASWAFPIWLWHFCWFPCSVHVWSVMLLRLCGYSFWCYQEIPWFSGSYHLSPSSSTTFAEP